MIKEKFYTCRYDRAFKEVFMNENNKDILEKLLESILKVKIEEIKYLNLERNVDNVNVKRKHLDLNLKTNIGYIEVEVNTSTESYVKPRNFSYICDIYSHSTKKGESYNENTLVVQINISYGLKYKELIRKYMVQDEDKNKYINNLIIYEINMDKYMEIWYNKDEKEIEKNKYIMMLNLQPEELEDLSKKDRMVLKYMSEIERVNEEEEFREYMSAEEDNRKIENSIRDEYIGKGIEKGQKIVAKSLLKRGMDKNMVSDITKLEKKKIEEIAKDVVPDEYIEYMSAEEDNRKIENSIRDEYIGKGIEKGHKEGLIEGRKKGHKEGRIEGQKEASISIAKSLLKNNIDINIISESTGLSIKEIESLKK